MKRLLLAACLAIAGCGDDSSGTNTPDAGSAADARLARDTNIATSDLGGDTTAPGDDAGEAADMSESPDGSGSECDSDFDCTDGIFCNGVERCFRGLCFPSPTIQCADQSACTLDQCDELNKRCDFVPDDTMCAPGQVCRSKGGCFTPADCAVAADCDDGLICNGVEQCLGGSCQPGEAVECEDGVACTNDTCIEGTGECQSVADHNRCLTAELCVLAIGCSPRPPCMANDDCDDGLFCNGTETCGVDGVCIPGAPPSAPDTVDCTIDQCSETLNLVVNTPDNARCSDGLFCNGAELCHPVNGCGPGAPPALSDGVACTTDSCNEALKFIEHTPVDSTCDDGLFCNGAEVCHPIDDCSPGEPPMLNDGVGCTVDTCSEVMDTIIHVGDDTLCDDGLFCTGIEECDPVNDCQTLSVPILDDGVPCTADACDESADTVIHIPNNLLCGGGDICTGGELCDVALGCVAGTPLDIDDNVSCTVDSCDAVTGDSHVPTDSLCDDGLFCNGVETCDAINDCAAGTPPGDDGNPCTSDVCNEQNDMVSNIPMTNGTVCSGAPRSICMSGSCVASFCGDGFVDAGLNEQCDDSNMVSNDGCSATCQNEVVSCDPDGTWTLSQPISHSCFVGFLAVSSQGTIGMTGDGSVVTGIFRDFLASGTQQLFMSGAEATCPAGSFSVSAEVTDPTAPETCDEKYILEGTFTSADTWTGSFRAEYTNVGVGDNCLDCFNTTYMISGTR